MKALTNQKEDDASCTHTPWMRLWMLMVYSLVTTSLMAERPFFFSPFLVGAICIKRRHLIMRLHSAATWYINTSMKLTHPNDCRFQGVEEKAQMLVIVIFYGSSVLPQKQSELQ